MLHITYYISCPAHQTRYRLFINLANRHQTLQLNWFCPDLTFAKFLGWLSKAVTNRSFADSTNCFHLFPTGTFFSKEFLLQTYSNFNRHYPELLPGRPRFPLSRSPVYRTAMSADRPLWERYYGADWYAAYIQLSSCSWRTCRLLYAFQLLQPTFPVSFSIPAYLVSFSQVRLA